MDEPAVNELDEEILAVSQLAHERIDFLDSLARDRVRFTDHEDTVRLPKGPQRLVIGACNCIGKSRSKIPDCSFIFEALQALFNGEHFDPLPNGLMLPVSY
jgi:hypothetical protein